MSLTSRVAQYENFFLDLDGCIWVGDRVTPGAPKALAALRAAKKNIVFITNDIRYSPEDFVRKLWRLGCQASLDEIVTAGGALQYVMAERGERRSAYVIGAPALIDHVAAAGLKIVNNTEFVGRAEVVIVGCHDQFNYRELTIAIQAVNRGAELIGTTRDMTFPMPEGPWPAAGTLLTAIENATGIEATMVAGKPEQPMYSAALDRVGNGRTLAVGDNLNVDIAGATKAQIDSALVLTGISSSSDLESHGMKPTYVAENLAELVFGNSAPSEARR